MNYKCKKCDRVETRFYPQCPGCLAWGTIIRRIPGDVATAAAAIVGIDNAKSFQPSERSPLVSPFERSEAAAFQRDGIVGVIPGSRDIQFTPTPPIRITDVADEDIERTLTDIESLDRVLGGIDSPGLAAASVVLIGGDPGAGKSTLIAQAIARIGERVLYATGEETVAQVTMRARRVDAAHPEIWIVPSNDTDEIIAHAREIKPSILVVDSVNVIACSDVGGVAGSISQIKESTSRLARFAKAEQIILIAIAHVTKDGAIAGPNTLNHLVDVVLLLDNPGERNQRRYLRALKNRYGSTMEVGAFEMGPCGMISVDTDDAYAASAESSGDRTDLKSTEADQSVELGARAESDELSGDDLSVVKEGEPLGSAEVASNEIPPVAEAL